MAFPTELHMPGAYYFDPATPLSQPLSANMFRPPMSPSASSSVYNLAKSTGSLYSDVSMANNAPGAGAKRKRTRDEVRGSTPNSDWNMNTDGAGDVRDEEKPRAGVREIRYTLAGQIETPSGAPQNVQNGILEDSVYSDIGYRKALASNRSHDWPESPSFHFSGLRLETPAPVTPQPNGWTSLALNTIGGVVGKVWDFCKTGGFRGFQAGGGDHYSPNGISTPTKGGGGHNGRPWGNEHDIPILEDDLPPTPMGGHNVPGGFPQSEYVSLHELSTPDSTARPAVKRRQTSYTNGRDELKRNWVIVDEKSPSAPAALGPTNNANLRPPSAASFAKPSSTPIKSVRPGMTRTSHHQARYSTPTTSSSSRRISVPVSRLGSTPLASSRSRPSLRKSHAGAPSLSTQHTASYAPPRSPASSSFDHTNPSSPSRIPLPTSSSSTLNPFAIPGTTTAASRPSSRQSHPMSRCASPAPSRASRGHHRNASNASAAARGGKPGAGVDGMQDSPRLTAEAKQLAVKKLASEREADEKMEVFNRRLMDMIRQGKEALGARVEVEMEFGAPTAGWEDDD